MHSHDCGKSELNRIFTYRGRHLFPGLSSLLISFQLVPHLVTYFAAWTRNFGTPDEHLSKERNVENPSIVAAVG